jgi:hypothetical protein
MVLLIKQSLETPLWWKGTRIDTPADVSIGLDMCKENMIELKSKDCPTDKYKLAEKLAETYMELKTKFDKRVSICQLTGDI